MIPVSVDWINDGFHPLHYNPSVVNSWNCCSPLARTFLTVATDTSSAISLVSKETFPIILKWISSIIKCRNKSIFISCESILLRWNLFVVIFESVTWKQKLMLKTAHTKRAISGPVVSHLFKAAGCWLIPQHLHHLSLLHCTVHVHDPELLQRKDVLFCSQ